MLYRTLCSMIRNVLYNMLRRAKNPPPFSPSLIQIGQPAVPGYSTISCWLGPHHRRGPCHVSGGRGLIGCRCGAVGGARRRSAGLDSRCCPVVLGWILGVPGQHLARNVLHAGPCRLRRRLHPASSWRLHLDSCQFLGRL
jgi:hypothetical protein